LAVRLLAERGWKDADGDYILEKGNHRGEFSVIVMEGDNVGFRSLSILQEQLRQAGVKINITVAPFDVYAQRIFQKRDVDGSFIFFVASNLQDNNAGFWHSNQIAGGFNFTSYADPDVDRTLDAMRFALQPAERRQARLDFQKALHADPPGIFLFWRRMPIAVHKRFRGIPEKKMEMRDLINVWESPEAR
jgi:peptide/nickel transport system substrate-binding protein